MKCDIIIPVWNQFSITKDCIENLVRNTHYPYRLIIIDNGSDGKTKTYLDGLRSKANLDFELIRNSHNAGFVRAVNQGLKSSNAPYICVMNNDTIPARGWLERMVDFAEKNPEMGLINPTCDGHRDMPIEEYARSLERNKGKFMEMNQCQGFCMLTRREVIEKIGYLDEAFGIGGFDDTDYSMRAHLAGYRCVAIKDAYVYHRQHGTFKKGQNREKWVRRNADIFYKKWGRHLRVAIPLNVDDPSLYRTTLSKALRLSYGLAREWTWVHIWLNAKGVKYRDVVPVDELLESKGLPPHQNLKVSYFNLPKQVFYIVILIKLIERLKKRMKDKRFDALVAFDFKVIEFLTPFRKIFKTGLYQISLDEIGDDWQERTRELVKEIKEKRSAEKGIAPGTEMGTVLSPEMGTVLSPYSTYRRTVPKKTRTVPKDTVPVDIIIPVWNKLEMTRRCLRSISDNTDVPYNLILIDNGSNSETKTFLSTLRSSNENITLIENGTNVGWVKAVNQGLRASPGPYICIMNNDTIVRTKGWLRRLVEVSEMDKGIGLTNPAFNIKRKDLTSKKPFIEVDFCRGYCVLIKRKVIEKIGFLDEAYGIGYYDDDDYSVRTIIAGFRCVRANNVFVEHLGDSTFSSYFERDHMCKLHEKNKNLFYSKWGRRLRLVFILTEADGLESLSEIFFSLARRQHIVYIWNLTDRFNLNHSNIREVKYPAFTPPLLFLVKVFFNKRRKAPKQYDAIFVDRENLRGLLSKHVTNLYHVDLKPESKRIIDIIDTITEETKREHSMRLKEFQ